MTAHRIDAKTRKRREIATVATAIAVVASVILTGVMILREDDSTKSGQGPMYSGPGEIARDHFRFDAVKDPNYNLHPEGGGSGGASTPGGSEAKSFRPEELLKQLKVTKNPNFHKDLIAIAWKHHAGFVVFLPRFLSKPESDLTGEAIKLAATFKLKRLRSVIARFAMFGSADIRPIAIIAAGQLEPWQTVEYALFFGDEDDEVVLAATKAAAGDRDRPVSLLISLFSHRDPRVREAAVAAIPNNLARSDKALLISTAREAIGDQRSCAIRALARLPIARESESVFVANLTSKSPDARTAALDALLRKRGRLSQPDALMKFVRTGQGSLVDQAKAIACLESTGSLGAIDVDKLPRSHPFLLYFTARCLLAQHDVRGVGFLLDILDAEPYEFAGVTPAQGALITSESRRLLGELSGTGIFATKKRWRRWAEDLNRVTKPVPMLQPKLWNQLR